MALTEEEADKLRYSTDSSGNVTYSGAVGVTLFDSLPTLEDQLSFWGFSDTEVQNVMNKINNVNIAKSEPEPVKYTDPTTQETKTNTNGSLLSNSAQSLKNTTDFQKATIELEKGKLQALNESNRIEQMKLIASLDNNRMNEASQILASEQYIVSTKILDSLKEIKTALTNQKFTGGNTTVHVDTTAIAESTKTIADATVALSESATVQKEHYDYLKNGSDTLKDSNGNKITPREVQAKINAEKLIEQEDTNKTTFDDIKDFVGEALGTVEDGLEDVLGNTDGFSLDFNPLSYIDEILMTDFIKNKDNYYPDK